MTKIADKLESLFFPALGLDENGEVLCRNRLAKRLLPPPSRLKKQMKKASFPKEGGLSQVFLDGVLYFTGVFFVEEVKCVFFLENFLPFYENLSRMIMEEANTCFWDLLPDGKREKSLPPDFVDGFAARTYRLRQVEKDFLRLLQLKNRSFENVSSCSLQGFFRHLSELLLKRGICLEAVCPGEAAVSIDPSELTFIVLHLAYFAFLFEGEDRLFAVAEKKKDGYRITVEFADPSGFLEAVKALLLGEMPTSGAMHCIPFLCMASACDKERFFWSVREEKGKIKISFVLPESDFMPDAFLSDATTKEVQELIRAEKEYFS